MTTVEVGDGGGATTLTFFKLMMDQGVRIRRSSPDVIHVVAESITPMDEVLDWAKEALPVEIGLLYLLERRRGGKRLTLMDAQITNIVLHGVVEVSFDVVFCSTLSSLPGVEVRKTPKQIEDESESATIRPNITLDRDLYLRSRDHGRYALGLDYNTYVSQLLERDLEDSNANRNDGRGREHRIPENVSDLVTD